MKLLNKTSFFDSIIIGSDNKMARVSKELKNILEIFTEEDKIEEIEIETLEIDSEFIYDIKDNVLYMTEERDLSYVLHSLESIILTVIFAIMANCNTFVQIHLFMIKHYEWLDKHIKFDNGLPSLSTIKRVVSFIEPKELEKLCCDSLKKYLKNNEPIYQKGDFVINDIKAMDGKTANSSDRKTSKQGEINKMNAMSIFSVKNNYCEATEFISDKTNEIPTGPELLKRINIENCIITFDAMSTQTKTIDYIVEKKAYYVAPVKGNQETLEKSIIEYFNDKKLYESAKSENYYEFKEKVHGTYEKREYIFTNDVSWLYNKENWKGLKSIGMVTRTYLNSDNEKITDTRYYISNLDANNIDIISKSIRDEWTIENQLHYYLDTVFMEDANSSFIKNTQKNLNIIRKFCLAVLKIFKSSTKLSMNSIRFNLSMDFENEIEKIISALYQ